MAAARDPPRGEVDANLRQRLPFPRWGDRRIPRRGSVDRNAGVGFLGSAAGPWRSDARSLDSTSYGRPADADVSLPRIRCRRALEVSFGPRPAQRKTLSGSHY
ncbi:hypothetical protein BHE74_00045837 [Ensete ventricosum]|nr:hypothetical protein BHE74_00045837 [Ensete ventricosum]